jgi:glutamate---cysteine ligase / carboxylate-amine ligase
MTGFSRAIVAENLWRAQRDGVRATFIDETSGSAIPCAEYLASVLEQLALDATELNCVPEADRTREIAASGTSADHQLKILAKSQTTTIAARDAYSTSSGLDR